jgi:dTDP-4-dehydrorhamnose reductase
VIRVLVTGAQGQVGADVVAALQGRAEVIALDRAALDLGNPGAIASRVREVLPQVIVNAAAYTAVDRAETDADAARAVNGTAPGVLASEAKKIGAVLVHYSTDYVFDGTKASPYVETDPAAPVNVYGQTKLEGERAVTASGCDHVILRTSWVYAPHGRNFLLTMLRLAETRGELRVVDDQRGAPTSSLQIARATLEVLGAGKNTRPILTGDLERVRAASGLYHGTAAEATTWFGFAGEIFARWSRLAGPSFKAPRVIPIPTREYPTPARRPLNSELSCDRLERAFGVKLAPWREGLDEALSALARR